MRRSRRGNKAEEQTWVIRKLWKMTWRECMTGGICCTLNKLWNCLDRVGMCITCYTKAHSWRLLNLYETYSKESNSLLFPFVLPSSVATYMVSFHQFLHPSITWSCLIPSTPLLRFRLRKWFVCRLIQAGRLSSALGKAEIWALLH